MDQTCADIREAQILIPDYGNARCWCSKTILVLDSEGMIPIPESIPFWPTLESESIPFPQNSAGIGIDSGGPESSTSLSKTKMAFRALSKIRVSFVNLNSL